VHQDFLRFRLDATLLRLSGAYVDIMSAYEKLRSSTRAIDLICITRHQDQPVIWLLLPLTNTLNAQAWMQRVDGVPATLTMEFIAVDDIDPQRIRSMEAY
jgi:hypothetical protein